MCLYSMARSTRTRSSSRVRQDGNFEPVELVEPVEQVEEIEPENQVEKPAAQTAPVQEDVQADPVAPAAPIQDPVMGQMLATMQAMMGDFATLQQQMETLFRHVQVQPNEAPTP